MKSRVRKRNYSLWLVCGFWLSVSNLLSFPALSNPTMPVATMGETPATDWLFPSPLMGEGRLNNTKQKTQPKMTSPSLLAKKGVGGVRFCSEQNLELIATKLLRDLPSYANRASQRARRLTRRGDTFSYMIAAGRPEFNPLPLNPTGATDDSTKTISEGVEQLFFTTLERQYTAGKAIELQQFHWLLLTKTNTGWRKVMMFTQTGTFPVTKLPVTPPRESSDGVVAQAVDAWLRDCQAGSVRINLKKAS